MKNFFELKDVSKSYSIRKGVFRRGKGFNALESVNLQLNKNEVYGLVGESGSGKSTLAKILVGLVSPSEGEIFFEGQDLRSVLRHSRPHFSRKVQMIFQNPYASLDPRWKIRQILEEGILDLPSGKRRSRVEEMIENVKLKAECLVKYPRQLSGGERQRIAIARALVMGPEFLVLDEPTSQLDVSIQSQIVTLLEEIRNKMGLGYLFISHDLPLVSRLANEIFVLKEGRLIASGSREALFTETKEPYVKSLLSSIPAWP